MTVITEKLSDVAGTPDQTMVTFWTTSLRENATGTGTVTRKRHTFAVTGGTLTTTSLDPGPARVQIDGRSYDIAIPMSATPIRLWPLVQAGLPVTVPAGARPIVNAGNVDRIQSLTDAEYSAISTPDPQTLYIITES